MPTQGLAAMTQAVANDITGYFQRHAVVRARQAGAAGGWLARLRASQAAKQGYRSPQPVTAPMRGAIHGRDQQGSAPGAASDVYFVVEAD